MRLKEINIQQAEFNNKDSCKIALAIGYRVYRPVPATQPCTLASTTGYRVYRLVLATQPCTLAPTTGYRVYRPGTGYTALVQLIRPELVTVIRPSPFNPVLILGQVDSKYLQIWLQLTGYRVLKSPDQFTGYTALFSPKPVQSDHLNHWLQSLPTRYRLYNLASSKPVTESTHLVHSTLQVDVEAFTRITSTD